MEKRAFYYEVVSDVDSEVFFETEDKKGAFQKAKELFQEGKLVSVIECMYSRRISK